MCIVIYFGYTPPPKTGSVHETESSGCEEGQVLVTPPASGRLQCPSIRPPQVPTFPQEAWSCSSPGPRWPAPGLPQSMVSRLWELAGLRMPLSRKNSRGGPATRGSSRNALFHVECGAWEPTFLGHLSLGREGNRGTASPGRGRWRRPRAPPPSGNQRNETRAARRPAAAAHARWLPVPPPVSAV
uniref:Uncharacterized protein n=1 Tax=Molossus molossus TaxID=27622 RepID=A0A7J8HHE1_MOLMO|nr:hypothetical protein HJG59_011065 [Molossus molossus]